MGIQLPEWARKVFLITTGDGWPEADEDALWALAREWERLGAAVDELQVQVLEPVRGVRRTDWDGPAAQAYALAGEALLSGEAAPTRQLSAGSQQVAGFVHDAGINVQYMKILVLEQLVPLAAQIAYLMSVAYSTFGATSAPAAALAAAGRSFAATAVRQLAMAIASGQVVQISLDAVAQFAQLQSGVRRHWNTTLTESATITGAIGTALGPLVQGAGHLAAQQIGQVVGRRVAGVAQNIGADMGHEYLNSGLSGVATGQGWVGSVNDLTAGATSGALSAAGDLMRNRQGGGADLSDELASSVSRWLNGPARAAPEVTAPVSLNVAPVPLSIGEIAVVSLDAPPRLALSTSVNAVPEMVEVAEGPVLEVAEGPEIVEVAEGPLLEVAEGPLPSRTASLEDLAVVDAAFGGIPAPALEAPPRLKEQGCLSAGDIVLGCYLPEVPPWQTLSAKLAPHLGPTLARLEPVLRTFLSTANLRTQLISMVRGDPWVVEINRDGLRGTIALDATLDAITWDRSINKLEFEGGAHAQVAVDTSGDVAWRLNRGLMLRAVTPVGRYNLGLGGFRDHRWAASSSMAGRTLGTHETVEPTAVWNAKAIVRLKVDLDDSGKRIRPPDLRIDTGIQFATPVADSVGPDGQLPVPTQHYAPPQRVQTGGRLGSTDVVVDIYPLAERQSVTERAVRASVQGGGFLLDQLEPAGRQAFGGAWAGVRKELMPRLRGAMLHQQLKPMMAGQPLSIPLTSVAGQVEVTAKVTELWHVRPMAEKSVFCVGGEIRREVEVRRAGTTGAEGSGSALLDEFAPSRQLVAGQGQIGCDQESQRAVQARSGTVARISAPGEVFDGVVELRFEFRRDGLVGPIQTEHTVPIGFRTIVERAEAVPTVQPTSWRQGEMLPDGALEAGPLATSDPEAGPSPDRVWRRADDGGLPDTAVITDVADVATIRASVEEAGRKLFGSLLWPDLRHRVLGAFHVSMLTAMLPAMTRGHVYQVPDLNDRGLPRGSAVAMTADLVSLTYRRQVASHLVSTNERVLRNGEQHSTWWNAQVSGAVGAVIPTSGDLVGLGGVGMEVRRRVGMGRHAEGKTLNNSRTPLDLAIFDGAVQLTVTCKSSVGSKVRQVRVPIEVAIPMGQAAVLVGAAAEPGARVPMILPPDRLHREGRLGAFDVVRHLAAHPSVVADAVAARVGARLGSVWQTARNQVAASFDLQALRPNLAALTTGDTVKVSVNGNGWSGTITLRARIGELAYQETFKDNVFEGGTHAGTTTNARDEASSRVTVSGAVTGTAPHVRFNATLGHHVDQGRSTATQSSGRVIATHRTKESAALFAGTVSFTAEFALRRLGVSIHVDNVRVNVPVEVLVRERDTVADPEAGPVIGSSTGARSEREQPVLPPSRVLESRRLSGADVVLDVAPPSFQAGVRSMGMADILHAVDGSGRKHYGRSWPAVRAAILAEVDLARLKQDLRPMMAGQPIIVSVPEGRVLITARVGTIHHESGTASTQFNSGTERSTGLTRVHQTRGAAVSGNAQVTATSDPIAVELPVAATAGLAGTVAIGNEGSRTGSVTAITGVTVKSREAGEVFSGLVVLDVRFERTTRSGRVQASVAEAPARYTALMRSLDVEAAALTDHVVVPEVVRVPPARVWSLKPGNGLCDTDVVHSLPDTGGIRQALDLHGPALFGRKDWQRIGDVVLDTVNNAQLAAHLAGMTRGEPLVSPLLLTRPIDPPAGVRVTARLVQLRYLGPDAVAELSVVNETTDRDGYGDQRWWLAGARGHLGAQGDVLGTKIAGALNVGATRRSRDGVGQTVSGLEVNDAIYAEPSARYEGYVSFTVTLHRGEQQRTFTGLAPVELSIPLAETGVVDGAEAGQSRVFEPTTGGQGG